MQNLDFTQTPRQGFEREACYRHSPLITCTLSQGVIDELVCNARLYAVLSAIAGTGLATLTQVGNSRISDYRRSSRDVLGCGDVLHPPRSNCGD